MTWKRKWKEKQIVTRRMPTDSKTCPKLPEDVGLPPWHLTTVLTLSSVLREGTRFDMGAPTQDINVDEARETHVLNLSVTPREVADAIPLVYSNYGIIHLCLLCHTEYVDNPEDSCRAPGSPHGVSSFRRICFARTMHKQSKVFLLVGCTNVW